MRWSNTEYTAEQGGEERQIHLPQGWIVDLMSNILLTDRYQGTTAVLSEKMQKIKLGSRGEGSQVGFDFV